VSLKSFIYNLFAKEQFQSDDIHVELESLVITMSRVTNPEIPHEVTVVIPRAEIRKKYDGSGNLVEEEVILNSITVVHAPRHPLAGPPSPPPEIPTSSNDYNFKRTK